MNENIKRLVPDLNGKDYYYRNQIRDYLFQRDWYDFTYILSKWLDNNNIQDEAISEKIPKDFTITEDPLKGFWENSGIIDNEVKAAKEYSNPKLEHYLRFEWEQGRPYKSLWQVLDRFASDFPIFDRFKPLREYYYRTISRWTDNVADDVSDMVFENPNAMMVGNFGLIGFPKKDDFTGLILNKHQRIHFNDTSYNGPYNFFNNLYIITSQGIKRVQYLFEKASEVKIFKHEDIVAVKYRIYNHYPTFEISLKGFQDKVVIFIEKKEDTYRLMNIWGSKIDQSSIQK